MTSTKLIRDIWLIFRRTLREGLRDPAMAFIIPTLPPLFLAVLVAELQGDIVNLPGFPTDNYIAWIAPGALLLTAMIGAGFTATGMVIDAQSGYLDRLRLLPIRPAAILLGRLAFDMVRVLPGAAIVLIATLALGAELNDGLLGALAIFGLVAVWSLAWNSLFYVAALRTMNPQTSLMLAPMFLPFMFTSTVLMPKHLMPGWIQVVSDLNPLTHLSEAARMFMTGGFNWGDLGLALGFTAGVAAVGLFFAGRSFAALVTAD